MDDSTRRDIMAVQARLGRIERERWAWRAGMGAVLALLFLTGAQAAPGVLDEIRTRKVVVVDAQGKARASLAVLSDGSPGLTLLDAQGKLRVGLNVVGNPRLMLYDAQEKPRVDLAVWLDGSVALDLTDTQGKMWANLAARPEGAGLALSYAQGRVGAGLTALSDGTVGLTLYDAQQKPQAGLLLDKDGKVLWKAP